MRPDLKPEGLRPSMSWLHTWSGLLLGWLLYAVFFTGTLSYFLDEINVWMKPELHASQPGPDSARLALQTMERIAPAATNWTLTLPGERHNTVQASWREPGAAQGRAGTQRAEIDAGTGEVLTPRETRGGNFLYRFHFELHAMPREWGRWIVGIATFAMLVAIISGVITHKKIFSDFFTFRPRKGQRSWLDAHNASAVLALPFHFVLTFSGLLLLMYMLMPFGRDAAYGGDLEAFNADRRAALGVVVAPQGGAQGARPGGAPREGDARGDAGPRGERGGREARAPAPLADIGPMLTEAAHRWPRGTETIVVNAPGTSRATVELRQGGNDSLLGGRGGAQRLVFDSVSGRLVDAPTPPAPSAANATYNVLAAVHLGRFAGPGLRWLLFLSGVVGTLMVATGLVLWVVKRLPERRKLGRTPSGHRLVEVLNVAAVGGLSLAVAGYFWANRLLPVDMAARPDAEIQAFFLVWLASLVHAALRPHRAAWREQLALGALLFAALPLLNPLTGGAALPHSLAVGLWPVAGFDLCMLAIGAMHAAAAWHLRGVAGAKAKPAAAAAVARNTSREELPAPAAGEAGGVTT